MSGMITSITPSVEITCAACREQGTTVIKAFDADELVTEINDWTAALTDEERALLPASHAEHEDGDLWVTNVFDWDGTLSEECHPSLAEMVWEYVDRVGNDRRAFGAYINTVGIAPGDIGMDTIREFRDVYAGVWDTERDFAQHCFAEESYSEELDPLRNYIDWDSYTNDLFGSDYFSVETERGGVYVFRNV